MNCQVLLSVIDTTLVDSARQQEGEGLEGKEEKGKGKGKEVWAVVSETLDNFLFPEAKHPQVSKV